MLLYSKGKASVYNRYLIILLPSSLNYKYDVIDSTLLILSMLVYFHRVLTLYLCNPYRLLCKRDYPKI